jgi:tRNA-Thr(GGU) m(6)t(6)A37 methyltransferase TsaA
VTFDLQPIGVVRSRLRARADAPPQAFEGAPSATLELEGAYAEGLQRLEPGTELILLTWLDRADRSVLLTHPRDDETIPLTGVFLTRSPDRPNPVGLHRVKVVEFEPPATLRVEALEALDGTPILDLKAVVEGA